MTDYTELVKALRCCANSDDYCSVCERYEEGLWCGDKLINQAADAIEELSAENKKFGETIKRAYLIINSLMPNTEET